jgi:predicted acetyltransferase
MRVGHAVIRAGAIGYVATDPAFRGRGLAAKLLDEWTAELTARGEHLSFLTGIPGFYERFGYAIAFANDEHDAPALLVVRTTLESPPGLVARPLEDGDIAAVARLYDKENAGRTGTIVRSRAYWSWLLAGLLDSGRVRREDMLVVEAPESRNRVQAYVLARRPADGRVEVVEAAASTPDAAIAVLAALRGGVVELKLPLDHPVMHAAIRLGATVHGYSFGTYARILDLAGLFDAIAAELRQRLRAAGGAARHGTVRFVTDIGSVEVGGGGPTAAIEIPQALLVKLVTGFADVRWLARVAGLDIPVGLWPTLRAMFPRGCPYVWNVDVGY